MIKFKYICAALSGCLFSFISLVVFSSPFSNEPYNFSYNNLIIEDSIIESNNQVLNNNENIIDISIEFENDNITSNNQDIITENTNSEDNSNILNNEDNSIIDNNIIVDDIIVDIIDNIIVENPIIESNNEEIIIDEIVEIEEESIIEEIYIEPEKGYCLSHIQGETIANQNKLIYMNEINQIKQEINRYRIENGLNPVEFIDLLDTIAGYRSAENAWCDWMRVDNTTGNHLRPNGNIAYSIFDEYGMSGRDFGEILARYFTNTTKTLDAWKKSESHNNIILGNYSICGVGIDKDSEGRYYFTCIFAN